MIYKVVAIAGTFDHLHKGHKGFISRAFEVGEKVVVGLTSDEYTTVKISNTQYPITNKIQIQNFQTRKIELGGFLERCGYKNRFEIVKINDVYGPSITDARIEALVLTRETYEGGREVNRKRREKGLKPLPLILVPLVMANDKKRISSTRIRDGQIDRAGDVFHAYFNFKERIPDDLRLKLKEPLGDLIGNDPENTIGIEKKLKNYIQNRDAYYLITVGDEVTGTVNKLKIQVSLSIVDFHINRIRRYQKLSDLFFSQVFLGSIYKDKVITLRNPAGNIRRQQIHSIQKSITGFLLDGKLRVIRVIGEEDLAALPVIMLAPLGSLVMYGQPRVGIVAVEVTEEKKKEIAIMMNRYR